MSCYQIKTFTSVEGMEELRSLWESSQWHPNADFRFFQLIVGIRTNVVSPCIFAVYDDGTPISLLAGRIENAHLPVRLGYATLAKIPMRQLVIIDGAFMGNRSEIVWAQLLDFVDKFLVTAQIDLAYFEQVKIGSPLHLLAQASFGRTRFRPVRDPSEHWLMRLPKTWDEFLKSRSKKHRYWLKRLENILNKDFPGQWSARLYTTAGEAREFADAAEAIASTTYHRSLGVGFARNEENLRRVELEANQERLRGYVLSIKGEPKAFWHCIVFQKTLHLCSTGYQPSLRDYELGTILLMKVFQDHCEKGGEMVDFGLGEAGYKQRFGSEHFTEASILLFAKTGRGLRLNILNGLTRFITKIAKSVLDRLKITQRFKTLWRRKLEKKTVTVEAKEPEPVTKLPASKS